MQPFLKTMASFLQKLFLTTSSGITFCSEVENPEGSPVRFLRVFCWKQETEGKLSEFPLNCRPGASAGTASGSWKALRTLFSIDSEFKEQRWERVARKSF